MNSGGVRPNKLWHWFAVAFLVATFLAEPKASMALTWELFRGAGTVGGELLTGEPEPDVLNLQPDSATEPNGTEDDATDHGNESVEGGDRFESAPPADTEYVIGVDGDTVRSVLDHGVTGVAVLHDEVDAVQRAGGFTVKVGDRP